MCPDEATGLYTLSRPLTPVLKRALKKSDNLSAEALFYHLGIHHSDEKYVGYKDAQDVIYDFMKMRSGIILMIIALWTVVAYHFITIYLQH